MQQKEGGYKTELKNRIEKELPGSMVFHLNPNERQGIPDLLILYKSKWATLEGKKSLNEPYRPNQPYYIELMNSMSFSNMICPEITDDVLSEMYEYLQS